MLDMKWSNLPEATQESTSEMPIQRNTITTMDRYRHASATASGSMSSTRNTIYPCSMKLKQHNNKTFGAESINLIIAKVYLI